MGELEEAKAKAAAAYNAAADYFDHPVSSFWHRFGRRTVERLGLHEGETVLDVCCGSGGSALPAAEAVGAKGKVVAVDLAERLVQLGEAKARAKGLGNIEFKTGDMLALGYPDASFDVAVCVFGIFFVPDMAAAAKELWRMLRPGGRLAITTWGPDLFEPANSAFWEVIRAERPEIMKGFNPWERISTPAGLREMLGEAGIENVEIVAEAERQRPEKLDLSIPCMPLAPCPNGGSETSATTVTVVSSARSCRYWGWEGSGIASTP